MIHKGKNYPIILGDYQEIMEDYSETGLVLFINYDFFRI